MSSETEQSVSLPIEQSENISVRACMYVFVMINTETDFANNFLMSFPIRTSGRQVLDFREKEEKQTVQH